jgi:nucleoporin POM152
LQVPLPKTLQDGEGGSGKFTITLLSVEDGNGCVRKLPAASIEVEVNREKVCLKYLNSADIQPTARFAKREKLVITEGDTVRASLRLTGEPVSARNMREVFY